MRDRVLSFSDDSLAKELLVKEYTFMDYKYRLERGKGQSSLNHLRKDLMTLSFHTHLHLF